MSRAPRWDVERAKKLAATGSTLPAAADELGIPKGTLSSYLGTRGLKWSSFGDDATSDDDSPTVEPKASTRAKDVHRGMTLRELCDEHDRQEDEIRDLRDELLEALRENKRLRVAVGESEPT